MSTGSEFDPAAPLTPSGNLRRRQIFSRLSEFGATTAAVLAVGVLVIVVYTVVSRGASALNLDFLIKGAPAGIGPELVGTAIIVAIATVIAMPLGVLIALYLTEYAGNRAANLVKMTMDLMNGLPSIIIGLFIFGLMVNHKKQSGLAASVALAIIMLPLIARGSQGVLMLIPKAQREAADALGVSRWRAVLGIILPSALGGIVTATVLSVARAAGETAPLIFASSVFDPGRYSFNPLEALPNVPVRIYSLSEEANPEGFTEAWGLSLLLISVILFASLGARALLTRSKRRMSS
ncbi:MAG: phosphate transport system permease protein [Solirubrobacterales bacterium]|jgi:phosphate transport system permease protein|nr:phosphate transport system permease protein [Solirubrobacterales bacterium]